MAETHTFHLPCGEMTITLEDVAMMLALPISGEPVMGSTASSGWRDMVEELLGLRLDEDSHELKTSSVVLTWLEDNFQNLDEDANKETVERT